MLHRHILMIFGLWMTLLLSGMSIAIAQTDDETAVALTELTIVEAAHAINSGEITSEALVSALLERIDRYAYLNAFVLIDPAAALEQARFADEAVRSGEELGPLHGVPLIIKDNIDIAGLPTTAATPALMNNIPTENAPIIDALLDAGAIILGKANMHELALGSTGTGSAFGPTLNPYNPLLFPGGSSSGTAAAVSANLVPGGLGSDTAGSIRMPAAMTGVYGFRPSVGRYSQEGIVPLSHSRDTAGPMTRSAEDMVLLDSVITGDFSEVTPANLAGLRLGVPRGFFYENLHGETARRVETALAALEAAGVTLIEADIPNVGELDESIFFPMAFYELPRDMSAYLEGTGVSFEELTASIASPDVAGLFNMVLAQPVPEEGYQFALSQQRLLQETITAYFEEYDVDAIIFPTIPLPARPVEGSAEPASVAGPLIDLDGMPVPSLFYSRNAGIANSANLPGLTLPIGLTADGLPVGIEINGLTNTDRDLLAIGLALEGIFDPTPGPVLP
jgi:indoleacetamide hydrolase